MNGYEYRIRELTDESNRPIWHVEPIRALGLSATIEVLLGQMEHSAKNASILRDQLDTKTAELDTKTAELDTKTTELATKSDQLATKTNELATKTTEYNDLNDQYDDLDTTFKDTTAKLTKANSNTLSALEAEKVIVTQLKKRLDPYEAAAVESLGDNTAKRAKALFEMSEVDRSRILFEMGDHPDRAEIVEVYDTLAEAAEEAAEAAAEAAAALRLAQVEWSQYTYNQKIDELIKEYTDSDSEELEALMQDELHRWKWNTLEAVHRVEVLNGISQYNDPMHSPSTPTTWYYALLAMSVHIRAETIVQWGLSSYGDPGGVALNELSAQDRELTELSITWHTPNYSWTWVGGGGEEEEISHSAIQNDAVTWQQRLFRQAPYTSHEAFLKAQTQGPIPPPTLSPTYYPGGAYKYRDVLDALNLRYSFLSFDPNLDIVAFATQEHLETDPPNPYEGMGYDLEIPDHRSWEKMLEATPVLDEHTGRVLGSNIFDAMSREKAGECVDTILQIIEDVKALGEERFNTWISNLNNLCDFLTVSSKNELEALSEAGISTDDLSEANKFQRFKTEDEIQAANNAREAERSFFETAIREALKEDPTNMLFWTTIEGDMMTESNWTKYNNQYAQVADKTTAYNVGRQHAPVTLAWMTSNTYENGQIAADMERRRMTYSKLEIMAGRAAIIMENERIQASTEAWVRHWKELYSNAIIISDHTYFT